ncbi:YihA family ribosome biogenesis GTP-binding protein [Candidatus Uhrbacteria bacterium]|nr:YihA family ribosome biogenesis GTP-binding protein [Candidatus Uhrbacteria bacterium]
MNATFLKSIVKIDDLPKSDRPHIAFLGRSNVGKSSLLNSLTGQKGLARVSATPGRTQTINVFDVDKRFYLIDLPGYGYAKTSKVKRVAFEGLLNQYLNRTENLKLSLVIIDARLGPTDIDREMFAFLEDTQKPFVVIANKTDKLKKTEIAALTKMLADDYPGVTVVLHSNVTNKGAGEIRQLIEQAIAE